MTKRGNWVMDGEGNRASISHWGNEARARQSLETLTNCTYCVDCENLTNCHGCARTESSTNCRDCTDCYGCHDCIKSHNLIMCRGCTRCTGLVDQSNIFKNEV